jgi:hypothetical protein
MTIELTEQEAKLILEILSLDEGKSETRQIIIQNILIKLAEQLN